MLIEPTDLIIAMQSLYKWGNRINNILYPQKYQDVYTYLSIYIGKQNSGQIKRNGKNYEGRGDRNR